MDYHPARACPYRHYIYRYAWILESCASELYTLIRCWYRESFLSQLVLVSDQRPTSRRFKLQVRGIFRYRAIVGGRIFYGTLLHDMYLIILCYVKLCERGGLYAFLQEFPSNSGVRFKSPPLEAVSKNWCWGAFTPHLSTLCEVPQAQVSYPYPIWTWGNHHGSRHSPRRYLRCTLYWAADLCCVSF